MKQQMLEELIRRAAQNTALLELKSESAEVRMHLKGAYATYQFMLLQPKAEIWNLIVEAMGRALEAHGRGDHDECRYLGGVVGALNEILTWKKFGLRPVPRPTRN